ncbi:hypothetical protein [Streptomyces sp. NPDC057686]|uniref:hypothetical protein n=1 Tax=Streptomyces sp. NPDC057686 TaxID=3346212 RepID=UPI0036ADABA7
MAVLLEHHDQREYEPYVLTGPEVLGGADQAALLGAALGSRLRFRALSGSP